MSAERRAAPQGTQSQTVCGQVQGVRAKAGVVKAGDGETGGRGGWKGRVCVASGRERQMVQRRRCRFGSVAAEGGLVMQFCEGQREALVVGCFWGNMGRGCGLGREVLGMGTCPAYYIAAASALGHHVASTGGDSATRHPVVVGAVGDG